MSVNINNPAFDSQIDTPLTRKERKFLDHYLEHGDVAQSATFAGYYRPGKARKGVSKGEQAKHNRPNAARAGNKVLNKIRPQIEFLMDAEGLSMMQLIRKLNDGLESVAAVAVRSENEDGTPGRDEKGKFVREIVEVPDHRHRVKYLEIALKMRKAFPTTPAVVKIDGAGAGIPVALSVQHQDSLKGKSVEELQTMLDDAVHARKGGRLKIVGGKGG